MLRWNCSEDCRKGGKEKHYCQEALRYYDILQENRRPPKARSPTTPAIIEFIGEEGLAL
jgi:hypothetical protein